jgi:hypothetical protein
MFTLCGYKPTLWFLYLLCAQPLLCIHIEITKLRQNYDLTRKYMASLCSYSSYRLVNIDSTFPFRVARYTGSVFWIQGLGFQHHLEFSKRARLL